jgi:enamine deaminase RidA (YjgF/YER057c/UK114 family)
VGDNIAARLESLGYELPEVPAPAGAYVPAVRSGSYVYTAGQVPLKSGELTHTGKVDRDVTLEQAQEAARTCALNALAAIKAELGSLEGVVRIVKVTGFVASSEGFTGQPQVVNGASELLGEVFGDAGVHARSAVGVAELPLGAPVEVEVIAEVR